MAQPARHRKRAGNSSLPAIQKMVSVQQTHNVDQIPMEHRVAGYLSEANFVGPDLEAPDIPDLLKGEDWAALTTWIDHYCAAHPLNQLYTAANALVVELTSRHLAPSKPEEKP